jgi:NAD(P)H-hydrate epimerase
MENAGCAAYEVMSREIGIAGKRFAVVCGIGNNGGDGLVVARKLFSSGTDVTVFIAGDASKLKGSALKNYTIVTKMNIPVRILDSANLFFSEIGRFDVIVDGLFGTGLSRAVEGPMLDLIRLVNDSKANVVSLDIPSGINGDTGLVMGDAVRADLTIAFGLPKLGNLLYPGFGYCGRLFVSHISFPAALYADGSISVSTNDPLPLPRRDPSGHKGSFGDALFIAGAPNYFGAPGFASSAHLAAGGGYARLAAPKSVIPYIATNAPEVVYILLDETETGTVALGNASALVDISAGCDIAVIGPGLSLEEETIETVKTLVRLIEKPVIVDGDGLTALCSDLSILKGRKHPVILTPHPGEMAKLTGLSVREVEEGRARVLREAAAELGAIIVLKGAHSLIGFPDGRIFINPSGNSGMATAGAGDVLTGTITAMYGLGLGLEDAVRTGVFVHGLAGDIAALALGEDGVTASKILAALPEATRRYRQDYAALIRDSYGKVILV